MNCWFLDGGEIENCELAKDFWWGNSHSDHTKYLIRLHDPMGNPKTLLEVKQLQIGQDSIETFHLSTENIKIQLSDRHRKRIWLHLRDVDLLQLQNMDFFNALCDFVTHFSYGRKYWSFISVHDSSLLYFIDKNLPNLQYLAVNDEMFYHHNLLFTPLHANRTLDNLKTVRFLHTKSKSFSGQFIEQILKTTPNLENIFGLPLKFVDVVEKQGKSRELNPFPLTVSTILNLVRISRRIYPDLSS
jgi:hypothetical protein